MAMSEEQQLKEYFDGLSVRVEEIPELKLNAAIRSGMSRPPRYRLSAGRRYLLGMAAALAIVLLFALPWIAGKEDPDTAQRPLAAVQSKIAFEAYRKAAGGNITVTSAIDAGLVQQLSGAADQQGGYVLTVDGIAADRKGMIILYSLQNNTGHMSQINRLQLAGKGYAPVNFPFEWTSADIQPGTTSGYEIFYWDRDFRSLPDTITFELNISDGAQTASTTAGSELPAQLSVPITLNHDQMAKTGELINAGRTLTIAGQGITIGEVYISTTGIYVENSYNSKNSKEIFGLINPHLLLGRNNDYSSLEELRTLVVEGKRSIIFANNNLSKEPVQLQINGIHALDRAATELVIDTTKQEMIKAPDNNLKVSINSTAQGSTMILEYYEPPGKGKAGNPIMLMLDNEFKDGTGQVHTTSITDIQIPARTESADPAQIPVLYYFSLGAAKLPQPLTFTLSGYPNPLKETVSLSIRK